MSVRAYYVKDIKTKRAPSFNLWHDDALVDFLQDGGWWDAEQSNGDGGLISVNITGIKEAIKAAKRLGLDDEHVKALRADVRDAERSGCGIDDYIQYYCY